MLTNVWGVEYRRQVQYLRVWVSRLRAKLEPDPASPSLIKTVQGVGYLLDAGADLAVG
jgi:two-component system KDP operon response regulator KdpE